MADLLTELEQKHIDDTLDSIFKVRHCSIWKRRTFWKLRNAIVDRNWSEVERILASLNLILDTKQLDEIFSQSLALTPTSSSNVVLEFKRKHNMGLFLLWRAGIESLLRNERKIAWPELCVKIDLFYNTIYKLAVSSEKVILPLALELIKIFLTRKESWDRAEALLRARQTSSVKHRNERVMQLLDGYEGLLYYLKWKEQLETESDVNSVNSDDDQDTQNDDFYTSSSCDLEKTVKLLLQAALNLRPDEAWLFVDAVADMLESSGQSTQLDELFTTFANKNPSQTARVCRKLQTFGRLDTVVTLLDEVTNNACDISIDPSDPLWLPWIESKLKSDPDPEMMLKVVDRTFAFLDYGTNGQMEQSWTLLNEGINVAIREGIDISNLWITRKHWWNKFHLQNDQDNLRKVKKKTLKRLKKL